MAGKPEVARTQYNAKLLAEFSTCLSPRALSSGESQLQRADKKGAPANLLVSERHQWVDTRSSFGRNETSECRDNPDDHDDTGHC
jgi:hypothetical protein